MYIKYKYCKSHYFLMPFWEKLYCFTVHDGCSKPPSCAFSDQPAFLASPFLFNLNKAQTFPPPQRTEITHFCACSSTTTLQDLTKLHKRITCGKAQHFLHSSPSTATTTDFLVVFTTILFPHFLHFCFVLPYVIWEQWPCHMRQDKLLAWKGKVTKQDLLL